jgi:hypothetical protein
VANNLTIESPNFEKISKKAGQETADGINTLWGAYNDTRATLRSVARLSEELIRAKPLEVAAAASVDNLGIKDYSIVVFTGASGQNCTGFLAPETGQTKVLLVLVTGAGTITFKHNATSDSVNRLVNATGADVTRGTNQGIVYVYIGAKWREVARSG